MQKSEVLKACNAVLAQKLGELQQKLDDLAASAAEETKSSAGDKYETGRAMLHIEQDQVRAQMAAFRSQIAFLNTIDPEKECSRAGFGSLVQTEDHLFFVSVSLGKITVQGRTIVTLSPESPIGFRLSGLQVGDRFSFSGPEFTIVGIQ